MIYIICLITVIGVLALDLITKYLAVAYEFDFVVIPNLIKFKLSYNTGAAFSFLSDEDWAMTFFIVVTIIMLTLILGYFAFNIIKKRKVSKWLLIALSLIFSGALGNFIDRLSLGKVRDFIFAFYDTRIFPAIFNFADSAVVIGVIMVCVFLLFLDKDAVFRKKQQVEVKEESDENNG